MTGHHVPSETILGGRYRLLRQIASGGMGVVWEAGDAVLGRRVAVKVLTPELSADERFVERFRREARAAAGLTHPDIAQVYDYGEDGPTRFIVMELVQGETLADRLLREGRPAPAEAARIGARAADALQAAHAAGIVHRDVKPGNIMLTPTGDVKVMDFGIAAAGRFSSLTLTGSLMGTAAYMSPEHAAGGQVTPASDVYSLAVVIYEMLTGHPPFAMETPVATALAHVNAEPAPISASASGVPPRLAAAVELGLAKDPLRRPQSAAAFAGMLRQQESGSARGSGAMTAPLASAPDGAERTAVLPAAAPGSIATVPLPRRGPSTTSRRTRRRPLIVALVALGAGLLLWALVAAIAGPSPGPAPSPSPSPSPSTSLSASPSSAQGVTIPTSIIGMSKHDAENALQALGLVVGDVVKVSDSGQPNDVVIRTEPSPGTPVSPGTRVTLFLSSSDHHGKGDQQGGND